MHLGCVGGPRQKPPTHSPKPPTVTPNFARRFDGASIGDHGVDLVKACVAVAAAVKVSWRRARLRTDRKVLLMFGPIGLLGSSSDDRSLHNRQRRTRHSLRFRGRMGRKMGHKQSETDKRQALDRLIANGFLESAAHSITNYQHTAKTELLFAQLCVGISGG